MSEIQLTNVSAGRLGGLFGLNRTDSGFSGLYGLNPSDSAHAEHYIPIYNRKDRHHNSITAQFQHLPAQP